MLLVQLWNASNSLVKDPMIHTRSKNQKTQFYTTVQTQNRAQVIVRSAASSMCRGFASSAN